MPVISTMMLRRIKCYREVGTLFGCGCVVNVVGFESPGFESYTVSVPTIHFATVVRPGSTGNFIYKQGQARFGWQAAITQALQCVVSGREVQRQLSTQTCRLHLDLSVSSAGKRQGKGVTAPHAQAAPGTGPPSLPHPSPFFFPPPFFPFSFPIECSMYQGLKCVI